MSSALRVRYLAISSSSSFNLACMCSLIFTCCFVGTPGGGGFGLSGKSFSSSWLPAPLVGRVSESLPEATREERASRSGGATGVRPAAVSSVELRERLTRRCSFEEESSSPSESSLAGRSIFRRRSRLLRRWNSGTVAAAGQSSSSPPGGRCRAPCGDLRESKKGPFQAKSSSNLEVNYI